MALIQIPQEFQKLVDEIQTSSGRGLPKIPEGKYHGVAVKSELVTTKSGTGTMLVVTFVITQGEYRDTEFTKRFNIKNDSLQAVKIGFEELASFVKSIRMPKIPEDSSVLHNKPLLLVIHDVKGKPWTDGEGNQREGKDYSELKGFEPLPQVGIASSSPASAKSVSW